MPRNRELQQKDHTAHQKMPFTKLSHRILNGIRCVRRLAGISHIVTIIVAVSIAIGLDVDGYKRNEKFEKTINKCSNATSFDNNADAFVFFLYGAEIHACVRHILCSSTRKGHWLSVLRLFVYCFCHWSWLSFCLIRIAYLHEI